MNGVGVRVTVSTFPFSGVRNETCSLRVTGVSKADGFGADGQTGVDMIASGMMLSDDAFKNYEKKTINQLRTSLNSATKTNLRWAERETLHRSVWLFLGCKMQILKRFAQTRRVQLGLVLRVSIRSH